MRKGMIIAAAVLLLPIVANSADFRRASWGMSMSEVTETESGADWIKASDRATGFESTLAGLDVLVAYQFVDGDFYRGIYKVAERYSNKTSYVSDYRDLAAMLERKYGAPTEGDTLWLNDLYRDNPSDWGMAVSVGHMTKYKTWKQGDSKITILLTGDNYDVELMIEYLSERLSKVARSKADEQALDNL